MKKRLAALTVLICLSALVISCASPEKEKVELLRPKFTVCVQVDCEDESLKYKLLSLRKRELRKIADVRVVDIEDRPDYLISLVAVINKAGGKDVGYSYSYSFSKKHYADKPPEAGDRECDEYLAGGIQTVSFDAIENVCRSEVAAFDQRVLEPLRKEKPKKADKEAGGKAVEE